MGIDSNDFVGMIDPEKWEIACQRSNISFCYGCVEQRYARYTLVGWPPDEAHDDHYPPIGDPATVLKMLEWLTPDEHWASFLHNGNEWSLRIVKRYSSKSKIISIGSSPTEAIINAIVTLPTN